MHTTQQAKTLWCPMARVARHEVVTIYRSPVGNLTPVAEEHHIVGGTNRDALASPAGFVLNSCKCVADQCAMWRWASEAAQARISAKNHLATDEASAGAPAAGCESWTFKPCDHDRRTAAQWVRPQVQADANRTGYCGIAGNSVIL